MAHPRRMPFFPAPLRRPSQLCCEWMTHRSWQTKQYLPPGATISKEGQRHCPSKLAAPFISSCRRVSARGDDKSGHVMLLILFCASRERNCVNSGGEPVPLELRTKKHVANSAHHCHRSSSHSAELCSNGWYGTITDYKYQLRSPMLRRHFGEHERIGRPGFFIPMLTYKVLDVFGYCERELLVREEGWTRQHVYQECQTLLCGQVGQTGGVGSVYDTRCFTLPRSKGN